MSQKPQSLNKQPFQLQIQQKSCRQSEQKQPNHADLPSENASHRRHPSIKQKNQHQNKNQQQNNGKSQRHEMANPQADLQKQSSKSPIQWQATYHQNQFHLQDPDRIKKLKQLQQQIEKEKTRLENLQNQNQSKARKQSFNSQRQNQSQNEKSIKSHINNISVLEKRKNLAQKDLHQQEDKYRSKIQQMKKLLKQKKQKASNKKNQPTDQKDNLKIPQNNHFRNNIKSEHVNIKEKATSVNKQLTGKGQELKPPVQGFKKQKAVKNLDLESKEKSKLKSNQIFQKETSNHWKAKNSDYQIKVNNSSHKQQCYNEPSKPSIKKQIIQSIKSSQVNKEESQVNNRKSISNQDLLVKDKSCSVKQPSSKHDGYVQKAASKKSSINGVEHSKRSQFQMKEQLINVQRLENTINKSNKQSQKQFSIKSSKKKDQLYQFLNQSDTSKKEGSDLKKRKQSEVNQSIKRQAITVPVLITQEDVTAAENRQAKLNSLAGSKVSESKNSQKSGNRSFLIHYPKQKSQSSRKSEKQSERYKFNKAIQEEQKKGSQSLDFQSKNNSLINDQKLRTSFMINHQSNKERSLGQQIEMIPKGQLVKLRQEMHELKKQIDLILENQQRSSLVHYSQQPSQNRNKILVQSRNKSRVSGKKVQSECQKKSNNSKQDLLQDKYPLIGMPQVKPSNFSPIRMSRRIFNIQSSIVQYDFLQEKRRLTAVENEKQEKMRLNNQIERLKKTIRQLRIEKIKSSIEAPSSILNNSIQFEQNQKRQSFLPIEEQNQSLIEQKGQTSRCIQKMREPQQIATITATLQRHQISGNHEKSQIYEALSGSKISQLNRSPDRAGKIVKNSPQKEKTIYSEAVNPQSKPKKLVFNLARRGSQKKYEPFGIDSKDERNNPLPKRGSVSVKTPTNPQPNTQFSNDYIHKVDQNSKQFNDFVRQSHANQDHRSLKIESGNKQNKAGVSPKNNGKNSRIQNFLKNSNARSKDELLDSWNEHQDSKQEHSHDQHQDFRQTKTLRKINKTNLDDIQVQQAKQLQDLDVPVVSIPELPQSPAFSMTQQELIALAKQTYRIFGVQTQKNHNSHAGYDMKQKDSTLLLKKYKNCVFFSTPLVQDVIMWDYTGRFYMGGWKKGIENDGQKSGQGIQLVPGKHLYKGQFLKGKKNGYGIMKSQNGNIYQGQWSQGVKNGRGKLFQATTGVVYDGQWKDNKKDGSGVLRFSSKQYYDGTFIKSMKHGFGYESFINGDQYKGEYSKGKFHGRGKYIWSNGAIYQGNFIEGLRSGQGIWRSSKVGSISDQYVGQYFNDKKNGYGRYVWANGCVYEGYFQNDLKNGKGRLIYDDGKQVKGNWSMGSLINTENSKKAFENEQQPLKKSLKYSSFMMQETSNETAKKFYSGSRVQRNEELN